MNFSAIVLFLLPPTLIATTYAIFQRAARCWSQGRSYLLGFLFYWIIWCLIVPLLLIGSPKLIEVFQDVPNRLGDPAWLGFICLVLPVIGGYAYFFHLPGVIDPAIGFGLWHLSPQAIVPHTGGGGKYAFAVSVIFLRLAYGWVAMSTGSILCVSLSHVLMDLTGWVATRI